MKKGWALPGFFQLFFWTNVDAASPHSIPKVLRLKQESASESSYAPFAVRKQRGEFEPGQAAPPLELATIDGKSVALSDITPVVFNALDASSLFSRALWELDGSLDRFIEVAPPAVHFAFASWNPVNASGDVAELAARFRRRQAPAELLRRMHFVTTPVPKLGWVPDLLEQWPTTKDELSVLEGTARHHDEEGAATGGARIPVLNAGQRSTGWSHHPTNLEADAPLAALRLGANWKKAPPEGLEEEGENGKDADYHGKVVIVYGDGVQVEAALSATLRSLSAAGAAAAAVVAAAAPLPVVAAPVPDHVLVGHSGGGGAASTSASTADVAMPVVTLAHAEGMALVRRLVENASAGESAAAAPAAVAGRSSSRAVVKAAFSTVECVGTDFAVDSEGLLRQSWGGSGLGNTNDTTYGNPGDPAAKHHPSMVFLAWAAQHINFRQLLAKRLDEASSDVVVVPVFNETGIQASTVAAAGAAGGHCYGNASTMYNCGPWAAVDLPPGWRSRAKFELDFALGCGNGPRDVDCPQWDHVVTAQVCAMVDGRPCDSMNDGVEFGRWVTTFSRGIGRWVTDVSALMPLLAGNSRRRGASGEELQQVNVTIMTVPWAGNQGAIPWTATLNLRFSEPVPPAHLLTRRDDSEPLLPLSVALPFYDNAKDTYTTPSNGIYTYFRWIPFNQSFNADYFSRPAAVDVPESASRAILTAVISGHGNDNNGCGEFCSTRHDFAINERYQGSVYHFDVFQGNPEGQYGCANGVSLGVTPNEYGTWLYGRDGWCNGREVGPRHLDVTEDLNYGTTNYLSYKGLWCPSANNCTDPDPQYNTQGAPDMMLRFYVTFYAPASVVLEEP